MCSIAAVGGTNQHLKLFLSLDRGYSQGDAARHHLARAGGQHRRPAAHGMARRSHAAEARDAAHLSARRRRDPAAARLRVVRSTMYVFAAIFGLGLGGEYLIIPLMAGELFGVARARPRDGHRADRRRRRRSDGADAGRLPARPHRQLRHRLLSRSSAPRWSAPSRSRCFRAARPSASRSSLANPSRTRNRAPTHHAHRRRARSSSAARAATSSR